MRERQSYFPARFPSHIPSMPPPEPTAAILSSPLNSAIKASVVNMSAAIEAAFCSAKRVTSGAKSLDVFLSFHFQVIRLFLHALGFPLWSLLLFQAHGLGNGDSCLSVQLLIEHDKREGVRHGGPNEVQ
jgi:hypothetical protein